MSEYKNARRERMKREIEDPWKYDAEPPAWAEVMAWCIAIPTVALILFSIVYLWNY